MCTQSVIDPVVIQRPDGTTHIETRQGKVYLTAPSLLNLLMYLYQYGWDPTMRARAESLFAQCGVPPLAYGADQGRDS